MTTDTGSVVRRQLSLFLSAEDATPIEQLRAVLDPIQFHLIPAHITLCREDELEALEPVIARLQGSSCRSLQFKFARPIGFAGHGILMPCIDGLAEFQQFREYLLGSCQIKTPQPHLTLAHPRNPKAAGNDLHYALQQTRYQPMPYPVTITRISLIEQVAMTPWRVLANYAL
jgi:hypothetical protein